MKTTLDALMEALETDTWIPPVGAGIGTPESFRAPPARDAPTTIRAASWRTVRGAAEQPSQDNRGLSSIAPCGSPHCAGCYEVSPGVRIHPPGCGEGYRTWLDRWEAKGNVQ
jgi:hypothetical protein